MTTDLYLIRHGESVPNVQPVIGGMRGDTGLTARGRRQAQLLEKRLRDDPLPADQLYVSTLPRALETGEYVARALGLPIQREDELQELRPGEADGLSPAEWRDRFGGSDDWPRNDPFAEFAPGGESWAGFLFRAGRALTALVARHRDQSVVAVTHGGVLDASFALGFGTGATGTRAALAPLNTSITHWRHEPAEGHRPTWTLVTFNDAGHLAGEPGPEEAPRDAVPTPTDEES